MHSCAVQVSAGTGAVSCQSILGTTDVISRADVKLLKRFLAGCAFPFCAPSSISTSLGCADPCCCWLRWKQQDAAHNPEDFLTRSSVKVLVAMQVHS